MRVFASQRGADCGPIAIYNFARLLCLPSTRGGYRANCARLKRATRYDQDGTKLLSLWKATVRELRGSEFKLIRRRSFWGNLVTQLDKAPAPAVGIATWRVSSEVSHIAAVWKPYGRFVILAANAHHRRATVPLYVCESPTYWPTSAHPLVVTDFGKLVEFWQVQKED